MRHELYAILFLSAITSACGSSPGREPLNVIMISLDTVRADRLSAYGYERATTTHLDRLANESVVFTDCVAQSTATAASHMSLFTGQFVHRHGVSHNFDAKIPATTLASVLHEHGWQTAAFTGHGSLRANRGYDAGFALFRSKPAVEDAASRDLPEVVPDALAWLDAHDDEPFFLFVHGYDPHCPYDPPEPLAAELAEDNPGAIDLREACGMRAWGPLLANGTVGDVELERVSELYDAEITSADAAIGDLIEGLRDRGLLDRSIVVFTSDHGEVLGAHGWMGHTRLWEEEIRVPLMIRFPEGRAAARLSDAVQHVDVMPTLLSALDIDTPAGVQGLDLMPRIQGGAEVIEDRMRITQIRERTAVRFDSRWKIVAGGDKRNVATGQPQGPQLYDLESDPAELVNLYDTPQGRRRYEAMWNRFSAWREDNRRDDVVHRARRRSSGPDEHEQQQRKALEALGYVDTEER